MTACKKCKKDIPDGAVFCPWCGMRQERQKGVKTRANGTGTAFKRGKTWTAVITVEYVAGADGKPKRKTRTKGGFATKTDALLYCAVLADAPKPRKAPLLSAYWETYSSTEMEKLSESKRTAYKGAWNKLKPIAAKPVDSLTVFDLRTVVSDTCRTYYPAKDAKQLLTHLFNLAAADGWAKKDLPSFIDLPKLEEKETEPFTEAEQLLLWESYDAGNKNVRIPLIMIFTGMMPGEMRKLRKSMIDLDGRQIVGAGIKTDERRKDTLLLPDDICPVLEDVMEDVDGDLLFPITETAFYDRYYKALSDAGITRHLTPYSCRHTTATLHAITEKTPAQIVRRIMRWTSTKMMDRYVHPADDDAREAVNAMRRPRSEHV